MKSCKRKKIEKYLNKKKGEKKNRSNYIILEDKRCEKLSSRCKSAEELRSTRQTRGLEDSRTQGLQQNWN